MTASRYVCGIPFKTAKGLRLCKTLRDNIAALTLISIAWMIFCVFVQFSPVFAVQASAYLAIVILLLCFAYIGAAKRSVGVLNCFYCSNLICCVLNMVLFVTIMIAFYVLDGEQFVGPGSGNMTTCEEKIPNPSNSSTRSTPRVNGNPLPCSFYAGMTTTMIFLSLIASFLFLLCNCTLYVVGWRMHEAVVGSRVTASDAGRRFLQQAGDSNGNFPRAEVSSSSYNRLYEPV
eukprot:g3174.t1